MIPPDEFPSTPRGAGASGMVFYVHDDQEVDNFQIRGRHRDLHDSYGDDEEDLAYITPIGQDANGTFVYSEEDQVVLERIERRRLEHEVYGNSAPQYGQSSIRSSSSSAMAMAKAAGSRPAASEHLVPVRVSGPFKGDHSARGTKKKRKWQQQQLQRGEAKVLIDDGEEVQRDETLPLCALFICVIFLIVAALGVLLLVVTQLPHSEKTQPPTLPRPKPPVETSGSTTPSQAQVGPPSAEAPTTTPPTSFPSPSPTSDPSNSPTVSIAPTISPFVTTSKARYDQGETIRGRFVKSPSPRDDILKTYLTLVKLSEKDGGDEAEQVVATIRVCEECQNATEEGAVYRFDESSFFREGFAWPLPVGSYEVVLLNIRNEGYSRSNQFGSASDVILIRPSPDVVVVTELPQLVQDDYPVLYPSKISSSVPGNKWTNKGVKIRVQFDKGQNMPSYTDDWIGLYRIHTHTHDSHDEDVLVAWLYTCGSQYCDHNQVLGSVDFDDRTMKTSVMRGKWPLKYGRYRAKLLRDYHRADEPPLLESEMTVGMAPDTGTASIFTEKLYYSIGEPIVIFFDNGGPGNGGVPAGPNRQRRVLRRLGDKKRNSGSGGGSDRKGDGSSSLGDKKRRGGSGGGSDQKGDGSRGGGSGGGDGDDDGSSSSAGDGQDGSDNDRVTGVDTRLAGSAVVPPGSVGGGSGGKGGPPSFWLGIWKATSDSCHVMLDVPQTFVYTCGSQLCLNSPFSSGEEYSPRVGWVMLDDAAVGTGQWPLPVGRYCAALTKGQYQATGAEPRTTTAESFYVK